MHRRDKRLEEPPEGLYFGLNIRVRLLRVNVEFQAYFSLVSTEKMRTRTQLTVFFSSPITAFTNSDSRYGQ